jgi:hypothetical protein
VRAVTRLRTTALALVVGCNLTVNMFDAGEVHVAGADGKALVGARVVVHAESEPHARDDDPTVELATGPDGKVMVQPLSKQQTGCILIPHGIGAYTQHVCVDHPEQGAKAIVLREQPWVVKFTAEDADHHCGGETGVDVVPNEPED